MNDQAKRGLGNSLSIGAVVGIIGFGFSTLLSGNGIYISLQSTDLSDLTRLSISATATVMITLLAFLAWMEFGRGLKQYRLRRNIEGVTTKPYWKPLLGAVCCSLLSIATAVTSLTYVNFKSDIQSLLNREALAEITAPMVALSSQFETIAAQADRSSELAALRSERERINGGTCNGSRPGAGPLMRLRAEHASTASAFSSEARQIAANARDLVTRTASVKNQADVDQLFSAAFALSTDPVRIDIASKASDLAEGYSGRGFLWEGQTRFCPDPDMANQMSILAAAAATKIDTPRIPPAHRDVTVFDTFGLLFTTSSDSSNIGATSISFMTIIPFVLFAFLTEAVGAFGAFSHGRRKAVRLTSEELAHFERLQWVLENFVWTFPVNGLNASDESPLGQFQAYLFVPHNGDEKRTREAEFIAAEFELDVEPSLQLQPMRAPRKEFASLFERMRMASGGATEFSAYPITKLEVYEALEHDKRIARRAIAFNFTVDSEVAYVSNHNDDKVVRLAVSS